MANQEREPFVLDFPNGQQVEDILKKADADYSKAEIDAKMAQKATTSDVEREAQNLQNQINEIVRAPESGGDVAAEVYQARVDADGVTHATLKARCDSDATQLKEDLTELPKRAYNKNNNTSGYYLSASGEMIASSTWNVSEKFDVTQGPVTYSGITTVTSSAKACFLTRMMTLFHIS